MQEVGHLDRVGMSVHVLRRLRDELREVLPLPRKRPARQVRAAQRQRHPVWRLHKIAADLGAVPKRLMQQPPELAE